MTAQEENLWIRTYVAVIAESSPGFARSCADIAVGHFRHSKKVMVLGRFGCSKNIVDKQAENLKHSEKRKS